MHLLKIKEGVQGNKCNFRTTASAHLFFRTLAKREDHSPIPSGIQFLEAAGDFGYLMLRTFALIPGIWKERRRLLHHLDEMGVKSLPLVLVVGIFSGAIIAWQAAYQFKGMITLDVMGGQTSRVIIMEMGPVLTALVISGRLGASITAEIGSMKLTGQVDALRVMAIDPVRFLVLPRVAAIGIMMPVLTMLANLVAILGSFLVSAYFLDMTREVFFDSVQSMFLMRDLLGGLLKSFIFGVLIGIIGCYMGLTSTGGASGVGRSTIGSFVLCAVCVLISDFFLWLILF